MVTPAITLEHIWAAPLEQIKNVLENKGYALSGNINHDRALAAMLYYNKGWLAAKDRAWVGQPNFLDVMSKATSLGTGIDTWRRPFAELVIGLRNVLTATNNSMRAQVPLIEFLLGQSVFAAVDTAARRTYLTGIEEEEEIGDVENKVMRDVENYIDVEDADQDPIAAADLIWDKAIMANSEIQKEVVDEKYVLLPFDVAVVMRELLAVDISDMLRKGRCYYLLIIWELIQMLPMYPEFVTQWLALEAKYGCTDVLRPTSIGKLPEELDPNVIALFGEKGLGGVIAGYVPEPLTHKEVIEKIVDIQSLDEVKPPL